MEFSESHAQQPLNRGEILSFSAGSQALNPEAFRKISRKDQLIAGLIEKMPLLRELFMRSTPLIVNCYPATVLGEVSEAVFVDTYVRQVNFSRAMMLAADRQMPVILIAQPLPFLEFLFRHVDAGYPMPKHLIVGLGGYVCPASAEKAIKELADVAGTAVHMLYGYGAAEVAFTCLIGQERTEKGQIIYRPTMEHIQPEVDEESNLYLKIVSGPRQGFRLATGDKATELENGWTIQNHPARAHPDLLAEFETWETEQWKRRTGYVFRSKDRYCFQLRQGVEPNDASELAYYRFAEKSPCTWLNKPNWS